MAEGSLYDRDLAALAIKQAQGDLLEAVFLVRAYRTTLPRFGSSLAVDTSAMRVLRRISATWMGRSLVRRSTIRTACWIAPSPALKPEPPNLLLFQ